jgi:hypothetical protein
VQGSWGQRRRRGPAGHVQIPVRPGGTSPPDPPLPGGRRGERPLLRGFASGRIEAAQAAFSPAKPPAHVPAPGFPPAASSTGTLSVDRPVDGLLNMAEQGPGSYGRSHDAFFRVASESVNGGALHLASTEGRKMLRPYTLRMGKKIIPSFVEVRHKDRKDPPIPSFYVARNWGELSLCRFFLACLVGIPVQGSTWPCFRDGPGWCVDRWDRLWFLGKPGSCGRRAATGERASVAPGGGRV